MAQMGWIPEAGDKVVLQNKEAATIVELENMEGVGIYLRDGRWSVDVEVDGGDVVSDLNIEYSNGHWTEVE